MFKLQDSVVKEYFYVIVIFLFYRSNCDDFKCFKCLWLQDTDDIWRILLWSTNSDIDYWSELIDLFGHFG